MELNPKYINDEHDHPVAVQIDIRTFEKIEETLENYALYRLMDEQDKEEVLDLEMAQEFYRSLEKR